MHQWEKIEKSSSKSNFGGLLNLISVKSNFCVKASQYTFCLFSLRNHQFWSYNMPCVSGYTLILNLNGKIWWLTLLSIYIDDIFWCVVIILLYSIAVTKFEYVPQEPLLNLFSSMRENSKKEQFWWLTKPHFCEI